MSAPARISPAPPELSDLTGPLEAAIAAATPDALPSIAGELARLDRLVTLRILGAGKPVEVADRWLETAEAAEMMGFSQSWLYGHKSEFSFCRKVGGRYRFSEQGIVKWSKRGRA